MGLDNALITGADGQLGRAFRDLIPGVVAVRRSDLDVTDVAAVASLIRDVRPAMVINCAAFTKVDLAESETQAAEAVNAVAPGIMADACNEVGAMLVHFSTDYVFDGTQEAPYRETDPTNPVSAYGRTKLEGERAAARATRGLIIRTSWVFGDGSNFVRTIIAAGRTRPELSVVDDQVGRLTYAPDLAAGALALIEAGGEGLFHLTGSGDPSSWADVAETALGLAGVDCVVKRISTDEYFSGRQGPIAPRPQNSVLDCSRAEGLGVMLRDWREALAGYLSDDVL